MWSDATRIPEVSIRLFVGDFAEAHVPLNDAHNFRNVAQHPGIFGKRIAYVLFAVGPHNNQRFEIAAGHQRARVHDEAVVVHLVHHLGVVFPAVLFGQLDARGPSGTLRAVDDIDVAHGVTSSYGTYAPARVGLTG